MGKKQIVEIEEDDSFDGNFSDEDEAPIAVKKSDAKQAFDKHSKPSKKTKKHQRKQEVEIRGADIFAQELPAQEVKDLKKKQTKAL